MGTQVYLGIGSNLNRDNAILFAIEQLQPLFSDFKRSPVYESKAIREAEPNFLNMVVGGVTELSLDELYKSLKDIEGRAGCELMMHNSTNFGLKHRLDIDILVFGDIVCTEPCHSFKRHCPRSGASDLKDQGQGAVRADAATHSREPSGAEGRI